MNFRLTTLLACCLSLPHSLIGATVGVGSSITSSLINGSGPTDQPNPTSNTMSDVNVAAMDSTWSISPTGGSPSFVALTTSGSVSASRGGSNGGASFNDISGSNVTSKILLSLGVGETADYAMDFTYTLTDSNGQGTDPTMSWSLVNTTTGTTIFSSSDSNATGSSVSISTLTGTLTASGTYELQIKGELTNTDIGKNRSGMAEINSVDFTVDFTIPEPHSVALLSAALLLGSFHRNRA